MFPRTVVLTLTWCAVAGFAGKALAAETSLTPVKTPSVDQAVRDGSGMLWASCNNSDSPALFTWTEDHWKQLPFQPTFKAYPLALAVRPSGHVVCLWRAAQEIRSTGAKPGVTRWQYALTEHKAGSSRVQATFTGSADWGACLWPTGNDLWITDGGRRILRLTANGTLTTAYQIKPDQMRREGKKSEMSPDTNPLNVVCDGLGKSWFYSDMWRSGGNAYSLRGFVIWDGRRWQRLAHMPGLPGTLMDTVARKDATHLWVFCGKKGLFEIDCKTLRAKPARPGLPASIKYVQQITQVGKSWYVVSGSRWGDGEEDDTSQPLGVLWRYEGGRWQRLIEGLDKGSRDWFERPRVIQETPHGLWVAAFGGGLWWVPRGKGAARRIDWRQGYPASLTTYIFSVGGGRVLAGGNNSSVLIPDSAAPPQGPDSSHIRTFVPYIPLAMDSRNRIWCIPSLGGRTLDEWDGVTWTKHAAPKDYKMFNACELSFDKKGRVWVLADYRDGQTAIYDPSNRSWQLFANYRLALQAQFGKQAGKVTVGALPQAQMNRADWTLEPYQVPAFTPSGRIAYRSVDGKLYYYDGIGWHGWTWDVVSRQSRHKYDADFDAAPFFTSSGTLTVSVWSELYQYSAKGGWQRASKQEDTEDPRLALPDEEIVDPLQNIRETAQVRAAAEGGDVSHYDLLSKIALEGDISATIRDREGTFWHLGARHLVKMVGSEYAEQFPPGEANPFIDRRGLNKVFVDSRGNTFLETDHGYTEYILLTKGSGPDTSVTAHRTAELDTFTFEFSTSAPALRTRGYQWRLDGGLWSKASPPTSLKLEALSGGKHTLEVAVVGQDLTVDSTPATVTFEVPIDPDMQVAAFMLGLSSPDETVRKRALTGLANQPERSVKALNAARPGADETTRWWIDATLSEIDNRQQLEDQQHRNP